MTTSEERKIDALRRALQEYHTEIREHIVKFSACDNAVRALQTDVYGRPGERGEGLISQVVSLKKSRRVMLTGLKCAWALLLLLAGAVGEFLLH